MLAMRAWTSVRLTTSAPVAVAAANAHEQAADVVQSDFVGARAGADALPAAGHVAEHRIVVAVAQEDIDAQRGP